MYTIEARRNRKSSPRRASRLLLGIAVGVIAVTARPAAAWHGHRHDHHCHAPWAAGGGLPWVGGPSFSQSCFAGGWGFGGFGVTGYRSFVYATPGFWYGAWYPSMTPVYGCGWSPCPPVVWASPLGCHPGAFVPAFGPVGVYPFLGFGARGGTTIMQIGRGPTVHVRQVAAAANDPVRPSNAAARDRAAKLVATGDRHLRAAVADRAKLQPALAAYRRAANIAADQPDTFLRQAIVLTALERADDAQAAVNRAIAIDGRLAEAPAAAVAGGDRLPPDPVFGDRPLGGPSLLAQRSAGLIGGIFGADAEEVDGPNWIADRWSRRVRGQVQVAARR